MTVVAFPTPDADDPYRVVREYAEQVARLQRMVDDKTLTVGTNLAELYGQRDRWVEEWLEKKPLRKSATGRPADPEGFNRFTEWLRADLAESDIDPLHRVRLYQLRDAHETARSLVTGYKTPPAVPDSERVLRPLNWFRKNHLEEYLGEVWKGAVDLAGSSSKVTNDHTRAATNAWKAQNRGRAQVAIKTSKAARHRITAESATNQLIADNDPLELAIYWHHMVPLIRETLEKGGVAFT